MVGGLGCHDEPAPSPPSSSEGPSGTGSNPTSNLDIEGFWATYANDMDGTVVSLRADGNAITGRGCLAGWRASSAADASSQCGEILGTVEGDQVNTSISAQALGIPTGLGSSR